MHMEVLQRKGERFAHLFDITQCVPAHRYQPEPQQPTQQPILIFMTIVLAMGTMECNDSWLQRDYFYFKKPKTGEIKAKSSAMN